MMKFLSKTRVLNKFTSLLNRLPFFFLLFANLLYFNSIFLPINGQAIAQSSSLNSKVVIIVSGNPITSNDISHRIALLRLQGLTGDLEQEAKNELIDEILRRIEAKRIGCRGVFRHHAGRRRTHLSRGRQDPRGVPGES